MATTRFADHLLTGIHSARPGASAVPAGTLYACSTHGLVYQSDGSSAWSTWATLGASGGVAADTIWDTKGDLAAATGADAASKLAVGSNGQILTADSTQATGIKWAAAAAGGATELAYATFTTSVTVSASSDSPISGTNLVVSSGAVTYDGTTKIKVEGFSPFVTPGNTGGKVIGILTDGTTTDYGRLFQFENPNAAATRFACYWVWYLTPAAGSKTLQWRAWQGGTSSGSIGAGSGGAGTPMNGYIRVSSGG